MNSRNQNSTSQKPLDLVKALQALLVGNTTYDDVAKMFNISESTLKNRIRAWKKDPANSVALTQWREYRDVVVQSQRLECARKMRAAPNNNRRGPYKQNVPNGKIDMAVVKQLLDVPNATYKSVGQAMGRSEKSIACALYRDRKKKKEGIEVPKQKQVASEVKFFGPAQIMAPAFKTPPATIRAIDQELAEYQKKINDLQAKRQEEEEKAQKARERAQLSVQRDNCIVEVIDYMSSVSLNATSVSAPGKALEAVRQLDRAPISVQAPSQNVELLPPNQPPDGVNHHDYLLGYRAGWLFGISKAGTLYETFKQVMDPIAFDIWYTRELAYQQAKENVTRGLRADTLRYIHRVTMMGRVCTGNMVIDALTPDCGAFRYTRYTVIRALDALCCNSPIWVEYIDGPDINNLPDGWSRSEEALTYGLRLNDVGLSQVQILEEDPRRLLAPRNYANGCERKA